MAIFFHGTYWEMRTIIEEYDEKISSIKSIKVGRDTEEFSH